ncbi:MAG: FAD-dependent oxidoreductase [Pararhodobacter sp.]
MTPGRIVIVGAGQGGLQAAASLRQEGHDGPIVLIGAEPGLPYQRPPLSKAFLKTGEADKLVLRPRSFFDRNAIDYLPQTRVEEIDRGSAEVRAGGRRIAYDHLILATGTRNLRPPVDGIDAALDLRTLADAAALRAALDRPRRVAVIGGGFIGLEFAAVARRLGHEVSIAEAAPRLMARAVSPLMSERFLALHRALGSSVHLGVPVAAVSATGIELADGTGIAADLVLLAAGVRPNTELAEAAGLRIENGIAVNSRLRTSDPAISALGDCASYPDPRAGRRIRLESVQAATDQARFIARRIVRGEDAPYDALPWFWSDQDDHKLQIAGLAGPDDDAVAVGEAAVFRFAGGRLTAVETVNDARTHMQARKRLGGMAAPSREQLHATGYDLAV